MDYTEYEERTAEYMRLAISMMKKHGIAQTPANYAVWYEYVSGNNANLMDALDEQLAEHGQLTEQQSRELDAGQREAVALEMADVLLYLIQLASSLGIDLAATTLADLNGRPQYLADGHNPLPELI